MSTPPSPMSQFVPEALEEIHYEDLQRTLVSLPLSAEELLAGKAERLLGSAVVELTVSATFRQLPEVPSRPRP